MDLQGRIIEALPERSGTSPRGEWKSQDFVVETHDLYPRKMCFTVWGADRLARFNIQVGQEVMVSFDIDAREYQGRWYNSIRAFDVRLVDPNSIQQTNVAQPAAVSQPQPATSAAQPTATETQPVATDVEQDDEDSASDLPF